MLRKQEESSGTVRMLPTSSLNVLCRSLPEFLVAPPIGGLTKQGGALAYGRTHSNRGGVSPSVGAVYCEVCQNLGVAIELYRLMRWFATNDAHRVRTFLRAGRIW